MKSVVLVTCSALLYAAAFMVPELAWGVVVSLALIALFFMQGRVGEEGVSRRSFFLYGLWWGLVTYLLLLTPLIKVFHSFFSLPMTYFLWCAAGMLLALYAGVWFLLMTWVCKVDCYPVFILLFSYIFFMVMNEASLWFFGVVEGCLFFSPVVPLVAYKSMLFLLSIIGHRLALLCLLGVTVGIVYVYGRYTFRVFLMVCLMCGGVIGLFSVFQERVVQEIVDPPFISSVAWSSVPFDPIGTIPAWRTTHDVYNVLRCASCDKEVRLVIFPESTCAWCLNDTSQMTYCVQQALTDSPGLTCIVGSHRREGDDVYASLYVFTGNECRSSYDKQHRVFFVERLPWLLEKVGWAGNLCQSCPFKQARSKRVLISCAGMSFVPLMCSDLFFACTAPDLVNVMPDTCVLCCINDAWFEGTFFPDLLYKTAVMQAVSWRRILVYVSHSRGRCLMRDGRQINLKRVV